MYTSQTHGNTGIPLSLFGTVQNGMAQTIGNFIMIDPLTSIPDPP